MVICDIIASAYSALIYGSISDRRDHIPIEAQASLCCHLFADSWSASTVGYLCLHGYSSGNTSLIDSSRKHDMEMIQTRYCLEMTFTTSYRIPLVVSHMTASNAAATRRIVGGKSSKCILHDRSDAAKIRRCAIILRISGATRLMLCVSSSRMPTSLTQGM